MSVEIVPDETLPLAIREQKEQLPSPYIGIAAEPFTDEQQKLLAEPIPDPDLDILPTGEIYASQIRYRRILNKAFGAGGWALLPRGPFGMKGATMMREYALIISGRFVAESIGEQEYIENNARMSYATASEGVKSNALVRCCKDIGIASECWDKHFADKFKAEHCVQVKCNVKGEVKYQWRLKTSPPLPDEESPVKCPDCGLSLLMHTKANPEDWWCNKHKGGCGHGFKRDDERITSQLTTGEHVEPIVTPPPPPPDDSQTPPAPRAASEKSNLDERKIFLAELDRAYPDKTQRDAWLKQQFEDRALTKWGQVTVGILLAMAADLRGDATVDSFKLQGE